MMGVVGFGPTTSACLQAIFSLLSGQRSTRLSYTPMVAFFAVISDLSLVIRFKTEDSTNYKQNNQKRNKKIAKRRP